MEVFKKINPAEFCRKFFERDIRSDGRGFDTIRKTTLSVGSIATAHGSSTVKIGNTSVICGIRGEVGIPPTPDASPLDQRQLAINVELLPICSPHLRQGKPTDQAQLVGQYLNDIALNIIDLDNLLYHSEDGDAAWYLYADIYCFDHDGNIFDACLAAFVAALANTRLPNIVLKSTGEVFVTEERPIKLNINHYPASLTFGFFEGYILADPTSQEETILSGTLSIVFDDQANLCAIIQPGTSATLDKEKMLKCMNLAKQRTTQLHDLINKLQSSS